MLNIVVTKDKETAEIQGELYKLLVASFDKQLLEQVLEKTSGNQLKAARLLGINRNTIRAKIRKLGIDTGLFKGQGSSSKGQG